jgi:hypothetical protein
MVSARQAVAQVPAYLHALADLRQARAILNADQRPNFRGHLNGARGQIEAAIRDIKVAATDDGKNPYQTPPPQSGNDPDAGIHSAIRLLEEAKNDVAQGLDLPQNQGLQARSLQHIEVARHELQAIINRQ